MLNGRSHGTRSASGKHSLLCLFNFNVAAVSGRPLPSQEVPCRAFQSRGVQNSPEWLTIAQAFFGLQISSCAAMTTINCCCKGAKRAAAPNSKMGPKRGQPLYGAFNGSGPMQLQWPPAQTLQPRLSSQTTPVLLLMQPVLTVLQLSLSPLLQILSMPQHKASTAAQLALHPLPSLMQR